jgi:hypothetical protein
VKSESDMPRHEDVIKTVGGRLVEEDLAGDSDWFDIKNSKLSEYRQRRTWSRGRLI